MSFWKIIMLIGVVTVALIVLVFVITACVIAGRESRKEEKDDGKMHLRS